MFTVPKGGKPIFNIEVAPPADPAGKPWPMTDTDNGEPVAESGDDGLTIEFSKDSNPGQKQSEQAIFRFTFAEDATYEWIFVDNGVIFDDTPPNSSGRLTATVIQNGQTLQLVAVCPTAEFQPFKFVFHAQRSPKGSSDGTVFDSEDPSGGTGRG